MPFSEGRTIVGWGVVRRSPWAFDGIYKTREEAEAEAAKMGPGYEVLWGENREGSDDFIFGELPVDEILERADDEEAYLQAEDGGVLLTEGGEPIELEGNARVTDDGDERVSEDGARRVAEDGDEPTIVEASGSASGVGSANAVGEAIWRAPSTPEQAAQLRERLASASWTGIEQRIAATPGSIEKVGSLIAQLDLAVEQCGLTNSEQQKAKALTGALVKLVSSPEPEWKLIVNVLNSPVIDALWRFGEIAALLAGLIYYLVGPV